MPGRCVLLAVALAIAGPAVAQQNDPPNGLFLIAKPGLEDPNFRRAVVLVTQARDYSTVGVIINRPTNVKLGQLLRDNPASARYADTVYLGGPVMPQVIVALFRSESAPQAPAFHVLKGLYLSLHPQNLRRLLEGGGARYRLYAGFSGWAPQQLQSEMQRNGWYILPADVETIFRKNMDGVWQELVQRAEKRPVAWRAGGRPQMKSPAVGGAVSPETPGSAARAAFDQSGMKPHWEPAGMPPPLLRHMQTVSGRSPGIPLFRGWANPATVGESRKKNYHRARKDSRGKSH